MRIQWLGVLVAVALFSGCAKNGKETSGGGAATPADTAAAMSHDSTATDTTP